MTPKQFQYAKSLIEAAKIQINQDWFEGEFAALIPDHPDEWYEDHDIIEENSRLLAQFREWAKSFEVTVEMDGNIIDNLKSRGGNFLAMRFLEMLQ